jgi:hypothetical protein
VWRWASSVQRRANLYGQEYQIVGELSGLEEDGKRPDSVSSPLLVGGTASFWTADETQERYSEAFDTLGDKPLPLETRSPYDASLVGIAYRKGQRAELPLIDGPTLCCGIQEWLGPAQTDAVVNGCATVDRDPNDLVSPQDFTYEFGETVHAGETADAREAQRAEMRAAGIREIESRRCWPPNRDKSKRRRSWFRKRVKADAELFAAAVQAYEAQSARVTPTNAKLRALEALSWLAQPETAPKLEDARIMVRAFYKSGLSIRAFCAGLNPPIWPNTFQYWRRKYFQAVADRLNREGVSKIPLLTADTVSAPLAADEAQNRSASVPGRRNRRRRCGACPLQCSGAL